MADIFVWKFRQCVCKKTSVTLPAVSVNYFLQCKQICLFADTTQILTIEQTRFKEQREKGTRASTRKCEEDNWLHIASTWEIAEGASKGLIRKGCNDGSCSQDEAQQRMTRKREKGLDEGRRLNLDIWGKFVYPQALLNSAWLKHQGGRVIVFVESRMLYRGWHGVSSMAVTAAASASSPLFLSL